MYEKTILLFDCNPLSARMSRENCEAARKKSRKLQYNNDSEGIPDLYGKCGGCKGVMGRGEEVTIFAGPPGPPRVAVMTIDGVFGYVG